MSIFLKPNPSSGVPIFLQLKEQVRHAVEIGALRPGDALPPIRTLAEELVVNANTIARVYRELEQEGLLALRHGVGAFIATFGPTVRDATSRSDRISAARRTVDDFMVRLRAQGLTSDEIRRLIEAELGGEREAGGAREHQPARRAP
jgi:GntR family transcriptional regulator